MKIYQHLIRNTNRDVYRNNCLSQQNGYISNQQPNYIPQGHRKERARQIRNEQMERKRRLRLKNKEETIKITQNTDEYKDLRKTINPAIFYPSKRRPKA